MKLLTMLHMRQNRQAIYTESSYWDSKAKDYSGLSISLWPNTHLNELYHKEQIEVAYKSLMELHGKDILDVGCGVGRMTRHLAENGANVLGVDFSPDTIAVARKLSSGSNPEYKVQSLYDLDYDDHFDVVCVTGVLTVACRNLDDVRRALQRVRRALKLQGELLIIEPLHVGFLHRVLNLEVSDFCEVLQGVGFNIKWIRQMHFWPTRFALAFVNWPRWITEPCYHFGQLVMRLPGCRSMGDYKAIKANAI